LIEATGSRRQLENGRKVREEHDDETEKAEMETVPEEESHQNVEDNDDSEADFEEDSGDESDQSDDDDSIVELQKKKRANNGERVRHLHKTFFCFNYFSSNRYPDDMGPLRPRAIKNTRIRSEPVLETRIKEYTKFLNRGGVIVNEERVITCVRGGGVAIVTSRPEVLAKKCTRATVTSERGDVTVVVDMLSKLANEVDINNPKPAGTVEYI
jgi:hypothetical protein